MRRRKSKYDDSCIQYWVETDETGEYEKSHEEIDKEEKMGTLGSWKNDKLEFPSDNKTGKKDGPKDQCIDSASKSIYVAAR